MTELVVTVQNRPNNGTDTGGITAGANARYGWVGRAHHVIGSGQIDGFRLYYDNWWGNQSTNTVDNVGNSFDIVASSLEFNSTFVPVKFGGSRTTTIADGAGKVASDLILPSQFGVAQFNVGDTIWWKENRLVPIGGKMGDTARFSQDLTGCQWAWYSPLDTTISSVDATGVFTATGVAFLSRTSGSTPIVLGTYIGGDKPARMIKGDSIAEGQGQTQGHKGGRGYWQLAQFDADGVSNPKSSINMGIYGSAAQIHISDPRIQAYDVNVNSVVLQPATNNFTSSGLGITAAAMLILINTLKASCLANGITRIAVQQVGVRTTSSDGLWQNEANQTTVANWGSGGPIDVYNLSLATAGFAMVIPNDSCRGVDRFKWLTNGTTKYTAYDSVHPSGPTVGVGHTLKAAEIRPFLALLDQAGSSAGIFRDRMSLGMGNGLGM